MIVHRGNQAGTNACATFHDQQAVRTTFAPVGTTMPNGMKIERRKIRGAVSAGMLCSARELGLICAGHNLVVDSEDGSFYSDGAVLPIGKGKSVFTIRGKTEQSTGEAATHGEVYTWVSEQLRHGPRTGQKSTTIKLTQGRGGAIHAGG